MSPGILEEMLRLIAARTPFAVATVLRAEGSVPGKPGTRMIVTPDGRTLGTVGGAGLEMQVTTQALHCIRERAGGVYPFILWRHSPEGLDSLCGGKVEVHVEYVGARPHLLICGGGHVGYEVARACGPLEYFFSVYDARPEFASAERFPGARQRFTGEPRGALAALAPGAFSHVLVTGHAYQVDLDALEVLLHRHQGWIGVIGSAKKRQEMFEALRGRGVGEEQLARIECPVGVTIGAETPAEIAVSILASVIKTRNGAER